MNTVTALKAQTEGDRSLGEIQSAVNRLRQLQEEIRATAKGKNAALSDAEVRSAIDDGRQQS